MIIGHIGARAGSKGLPGKNFRDLHGKPLLDWSLDQLFAAPEVDTVVFSTDCPDMYAHAVKRGTLDIGLRPAHLATDAAGKWGVWQHALEITEASAGPADAFLDLDCTSPLRLQSDISEALALFAEQKPDMVMCVCESRVNPYFNLLETNDEGGLHVSKPLPGGVVARQQAPKVYQHATGTYVVSPDYLRRAKGLFEGHVIPHIVDESRSQDIDSPMDFEIVRLLMAERLRRN